MKGIFNFHTNCSDKARNLWERDLTLREELFTDNGVQETTEHYPIRSKYVSNEPKKMFCHPDDDGNFLNKEMLADLDTLTGQGCLDGDKLERLSEAPKIDTDKVTWSNPDVRRIAVTFDCASKTFTVQLGYGNSFERTAGDYIVPGFEKQFEVMGFLHNLYQHMSAVAQKKRSEHDEKCAAAWAMVPED